MPECRNRQCGKTITAREYELNWGGLCGKCLAEVVQLRARETEEDVDNQEPVG